MTEHDDSVSFDRDAWYAKYLAERDRRLVAGRADIRDLTGDDAFADYRKDPFTPFVDRAPIVEDIDVAVVGAGLAGVCVAARLRLAGLDRIRMIDEAGGIGGTWYWNRYPGVMCDVESYIYLPMLEELGYVPTARYASGGEIHRHLVAIAEHHDLAADALLHTRVRSSEWEERSGRWVLRTDRGDVIRARYLVLATGILNLLKLPAIPGMETFRGHSFHTARWDYGYTGGGPEGGLDRLADQTIGVLGTGATAIQCVPHLAAAAKQLYVFQRTPSAIGVRGNRPTPADFADGLRPGWQRARMDNFQAVMMGTPVDEDLTDDGWTRHFAKTRRYPRDPSWTTAQYVARLEQFDFEVMEAHRSRIDEIVADPTTAEILKPYYRYVCKRPCFHDEYLETFNRPNVTLIDCPAGIERITEHGLVVNGEPIDLDAIVYATGFEPESTPLPRRVGHQVTGRNGITLADKWSDGAASLWGMVSHGFPNMFVMPAPGQQAVVTVNHTHITVEGAEHIGEMVRLLEERGTRSFDVRLEAEEAWREVIVSTYIDGSKMMSACTPSRINNEGHPEAFRARDGSFGGGTGDLVGFRQLLADWRAAADFAGFDIDPAMNHRAAP